MHARSVAAGVVTHISASELAEHDVPVAVDALGHGHDVVADPSRAVIRESPADSLRIYISDSHLLMPAKITEGAGGMSKNARQNTGGLPNRAKVGTGLRSFWSFERLEVGILKASLASHSRSREAAFSIHLIAMSTGCGEDYFGFSRVVLACSSCARQSPNFPDCWCVQPVP